MYQLDTLPPTAVLLKWAYYTDPEPYAYLARFLNGLGYRKATRKAPLGRKITAADMRRYIHQHIKDHPIYPVGRAATDTDYDRIKVDIINSYDEEALS